MALTIPCMVVVTALLSSQILTVRGRSLNDLLESNLEKEYLALPTRNDPFFSDDPVPKLVYDRSYRLVGKVIQPRVTRVGENLFTARGYGKRADNMKLLSSRGFGKRHLDETDTNSNRRNFLCTSCKTSWRNGKTTTDEELQQQQQQQRQLMLTELDKELSRQNED